MNWQQNQPTNQPTNLVLILKTGYNQARMGSGAECYSFLLYIIPFAKVVINFKFMLMKHSTVTNLELHELPWTVPSLANHTYFRPDPLWARYQIVQGTSCITMYKRL